VTGESDVTLVTMRFATSDLARSSAALARYVVVQKWVSASSQRAHFDSDDMLRMASDLSGLLTAAPAIELLDPISAHDLR
jgi:quinol monooxygenase YgiN